MLKKLRSCGKLQIGSVTRANTIGSIGSYMISGARRQYNQVARKCSCAAAIKCFKVCCCWVRISGIAYPTGGYCCSTIAGYIATANSICRSNSGYCGGGNCRSCYWRGGRGKCLVKTISCTCTVCGVSSHMVSSAGG